CGEQQSDSMGRGVEHGPLGAGSMTIGGQGVPPARRAGGERSDPGSSAVSRLIASLTREVPDFPEPGIQFKDLTPLLADRKGGKLPPPVFGEAYELEYGTATLEVPAEGIELAGRSIAIIDDVLATGGTVAATAKLLRNAGSNVTGAAVVLELAALGGRDVLKPLPVSSLHTV